MKKKTYLDKIRLRRLELGLSQENMAEALHISTTAYGDIERGKTEITLNRLEQIATLLHIELPILLGFTSLFENELIQLTIDKLEAQNEKLMLENKLLRQKILQKIIVEHIADNLQKTTERPRIGF